MEKQKGADGEKGKCDKENKRNIAKCFIVFALNMYGKVNGSNCATKKSENRKSFGAGHTKKRKGPFCIRSLI